MVAIRMGGMASGLPPDIVEQIMNAERIPVKQMESKKTADEEKLKLVDELSSKISEIPKNLQELISTKGFANNKITSGDPNVLNGVIDGDGAVTGSWQVEVIQLAQKPAAISNGFPDKNSSEIGTGYIRFETPEGPKDIYIKSGNSTLEGVAATINSAGLGLRASVINDRTDKENPFKLMVAGLATGDDKQVSFPTIYMLDGDLDFEFEKKIPASNAKIKVDGFEVEIPENTVKDVIPGVNLELKQAAPGRTINVSVKEDYEVIGGKIKSFVDAYNGALGWIQNQAKLTKDKAGRDRLGPLGGDGILRTIENNLRRTILTPQIGTGSQIQRLSEMGVEFNRNGTLNYNQDKFNKVLTSSPQDVSMFFRGDNFNVGFVPTVRREVSNLLSPATGALGIRKKGISDKIKDADKRIERKEAQLIKKEETLRKKFSDLESKMSQINQQGAAVAALKAGAPGG